MAERTERLAGYAVDMACIRRYRTGQLSARSRAHTKRCAMMGHCLESGYGLIDEAGLVQALDAAATTLVYQALQASPNEHGIWLVARRRDRDGEWKRSRSMRRRHPPHEGRGVGAGKTAGGEGAFP